MALEARVYTNVLQIRTQAAPQERRRDLGALDLGIRFQVTHSDGGTSLLFACGCRLHDGAPVLIDWALCPDHHDTPVCALEPDTAIVIRRPSPRY